MYIPDLILQPFAAGAPSVDVVAPPQTSPTGFVNFTDGYTSSYEISLAAGNPQAKAVERPIQNYMFNAMTRNAQAWQAQGNPAWYASMPGGYMKNALVLRENGPNIFLYRSLVDNNMSNPVGNPSQWEYQPTAAEAKLNIPMPSGGVNGASAEIVTVATDFNTFTYGTFIIRSNAVLVASPNAPSPPNGTPYAYGMVESKTWANGALTVTLQRYTDISGGYAVRSGIDGTFGAWRYAVSYIDIQSAASITATTTGTLTNFIAAVTPAPDSLSVGMEVRLLLHVTNGVNATLNLNGLGAKPIFGGADAGVRAGELTAGKIASLIYTSQSGGRWLVSGQTAGPIQVAPATNANHASQSAQVQNSDFNYAPDTTSNATPNAYGATYAPAVTALKDGLSLSFKAQLGNSGAATFSPNGLAAKPIFDLNDRALFLGAIATGGLCEVVFSAAKDAWILVYSTGAGTQSSLPLGTILAFPKNVIPAGFLELDGSVQNSAIFPDLSMYLGTTYNTGGEPAGFFRLPDTRAEFIRGWDHGRGVDVGRALGNYQSATVVVGQGAANTASVSAANTAAEFNTIWGAEQVAATPAGMDMVASATGGVISTPATGNLGYVRARNIAFVHCIKAFSAPVNPAEVDLAAILAAINNANQLAIPGSRKNFKSSTTGLSQVVTLTADQVIVGSAGGQRSVAGLSLSINGAASGANGLDAGSIVAGTWYSVWVIWGDSVPTAGLLSTSTLSPTLPAGYTHKGRVTWVRSDGTANKFFLNYSQTDFHARYNVAPGTNVTAFPSIHLGIAGNVNPPTPTWVGQTIDAYIPPTANELDLIALSFVAGATYMIGEVNTYGPFNSATNPAPISVNCSTNASSVDFYRNINRLQLAAGSRTVYISANDSSFNLRCTGWLDTL